MHIIQLLTHAVWHFFMAHEFPALFLLLLIEEAGIPIPIPGDTLVAVAGTRHAQSPLYAVAVVLTSSAAVFLGSSLLYAVMRRGGRPLLEKYGKYIHLSAKRLDRMESWFNTRGWSAIVYGRLIPGLRIPTTVMAGLSGIPYRVYAPTAAVAAVIWSAVYFWLGAMLNRHLAVITSAILAEIDEFSTWVIVLIVLALGLAVAAVWQRQRLARRRASWYRRAEHLHNTGKESPVSHG